MKAMTRFWWSAALGALATLAASCTYDPQPADGTLKCSTGSDECPQGYVCRFPFCYKNGSVQGMTNNDAQGGGSGGTTGRPDASSPPADVNLAGDRVSTQQQNRFIGKWTLATSSSVFTQCDNGDVGTGELSSAEKPSTMTITAGVAGVSDLQSDWLCLVNLALDDAGAHLFGSQPACSHPPTVAGIQAQNWTVTQFDILANTGSTAMHTATYTRVDQYTNGAVVHCTQLVTAPLTKK